MDTPWTDEYRKAHLLATIAENKWIPHKPHPRQIDFLLLSDVEEVLFGGAARGGKTDALLMAAFQYVDMPNYAALLLQKTTTDMSMPDAMLTRAKEWLAGTGAKWTDDTKTYTFPSGAKIAFGYLEHKAQELRYKGGAYDMIGFDELTRFNEEPYLYLFSRLSRAEGSLIPSRMRAATNPGDIGHQWVKKRFLSKEGRESGRMFVPSNVRDNPSVDRLAYLKNLSNLDSRTRKQLEEGDWSDFTGQWFKPQAWPKYIDLDGGGISVPWNVSSRRIYPYNEIAVFIGVDWATSEKKTADYTSFVVGGLTPDGHLLILDVMNRRINMENCPSELALTCNRWKPVAVSGEDDVLSKSMVLECRRMPGIPEIRRVPIGSKAKLIRWQAAIIQGENGRVLLPESAPWLDEFRDHLLSLTGVNDPHDDIGDAFGVLCRVIDGVRGTGDDDQYPEMLVPGRPQF